jgi:predicted small lipoprotein YifL
MKAFLSVILVLVAMALSGCTNGGYKGPVQTSDGQKMEEPDYNY